MLQTPVPVKWMAVESLTHKIYTIKSDVYVSEISELMWYVSDKTEPRVCQPLARSETASYQFCDMEMENANI